MPLGRQERTLWGAQARRGIDPLTTTSAKPEPLRGTVAAAFVGRRPLSPEACREPKGQRALRGASRPLGSAKDPFSSAELVGPPEPPHTAWGQKRPNSACMP